MSWRIAVRLKETRNRSAKACASCGSTMVPDIESITSTEARLWSSCLAAATSGHRIATSETLKLWPRIGVTEWFLRQSGGTLPSISTTMRLLSPMDATLEDGDPAVIAAALGD